MDKNISPTLTILLAEDDKGHAALLKKNLWRTCVDAQILHFSDGDQLLTYLRGQSQGYEPFTAGKYVLLLDIKMPGTNGIDVLNAMNDDPELKYIPVIMVTTTNNPREIDHCYELGCSFYIVKPSDYIQFMEAIQHLGAFLSLPNLDVPTIEPAGSGS